MRIGCSSAALLPPLLTLLLSLMVQRKLVALKIKIQTTPTRRMGNICISSFTFSDFCHTCGVILPAHCLLRWCLQHTYLQVQQQTLAQAQAQALIPCQKEQVHIQILLQIRTADYKRKLKILSTVLLKSQRQTDLPYTHTLPSSDPATTPQSVAKLYFQQLFKPTCNCHRPIGVSHVCFHLK